jgi:hypothetical protein
VTVGVVEVPDFAVDFAVETTAACARTRGAVASACTASTPTPASETIVIMSTENVAPRPDLGLPAGPREVERPCGGGGTGPRLCCCP